MAWQPLESSLVHLSTILLPSVDAKFILMADNPSKEVLQASGTIPVPFGYFSTNYLILICLKYPLCTAFPRYYRLLYRHLSLLNTGTIAAPVLSPCWVLVSSRYLVLLVVAGYPYLP